MLTTITVTTELDTLNAHDGLTSLREAIIATNIIPGPDAIQFSPALSGKTIMLALGELQIADSLSINGPGAGLLAIDASGEDPNPNTAGDGIRIFNIDDGDSLPDEVVSITNLSIKGGDVTGEGGGVLNHENLTMSGVAITNNRATEEGGGISSTKSTLTLSDSNVSGNTASSGGGIWMYACPATISDCSITSNSGHGGGIGRNEDSAQQTLITITGCTLSANYGSGISNGFGRMNVRETTIDGTTYVSQQDPGFGIVNQGDLAVMSSAISNNGGGVSNGGTATIIDSTIAGSHYAGVGGISNTGQLSLFNSTVSGNTGFFVGGGINNSADGVTTLVNTIVAGNFAAESQAPDVLGAVTISDSLIGNSARATITDNGGNLIGTSVAPINALLGPLADNGGPTKTMALLAGSPAIDAGDPAAVAGVGSVPLYDQREAQFGRVFNSKGIGMPRIDIGAFELQPIPPAMLGDFNHDGIVDAADYTVWRDKLGSAVVAGTSADGDGNGIVDAADYNVWRLHFGLVLPTEGAGSGEHTSDSTSPIASDAESTAEQQRVSDIRSTFALIDVELMAANPIQRPNDSQLTAMQAGLAAVARRDNVLLAWTALRSEDRWRSGKTKFPDDALAIQSDAPQLTAIDGAFETLLSTPTR